MAETKYVLLDDDNNLTNIIAYGENKKKSCEENVYET